MTIIRTVDVDPDEHTPRTTADLTEVIADAMKALSLAMASAGPVPAIGWPIDPQDLPERLGTTASRLQMLLHEYGGQLRAHAKAGTFEAARGVDVRVVVETAQDHLAEAARLAGELGQALAAAQNTLAPIHVSDPNPDGEDEA